MGKLEMSEREKMGEPIDFDMEARWSGELEQRERREMKEWARKAAAWGSCELRLGKRRSRLVVVFDRPALERLAREHIGHVESLLLAQRETGQDEAALALAGMRQAPIDSAGGLLVKDYGAVLARGWAAQTSGSLQALIPARCGLRVRLGKGLRAGSQDAGGGARAAPAAA